MLTLPGYCGYVPSIKSENAFGESYGKTTEQSVAGHIKQGFEMTGADKYTSITQSKFTNQNEMLRVMRPADVFEPGYDTIEFQKPENANQYVSASQKQGLTMSFTEARKIAHC